jgi:hypothetical protein
MRSEVVISAVRVQKIKHIIYYYICRIILLYYQCISSLYFVTYIHIIPMEIYDGTLIKYVGEITKKKKFFFYLYIILSFIDDY